MRHFLLYKQPNQYASFPHVALDANGDLLVIFRVAGARTAKAALTGTHTHQDIDSRIWFMRSKDGGENWTAPSHVAAGDPASGVTPSDPAVTALRDGRLLARFAQWKLVPTTHRSMLEVVHRHFVRTGQLGQLYGNGFAISENGGESWQTLSTFMLDRRLAVSREAVLELSDGSLVLSVYEGYPRASESSYLVRSWNGGTEWGDSTLIAGTFGKYRETPNYNEASIVALDDTTLLALLRVDVAFTTDTDEFMSEGGIGELEWSVSYDAGFTWDIPRKAGIWGQPAHLLKLQDGSLLATYGHRRQAYGIRARQVTFKPPIGWQIGPEIILRDDGAGWDIGYPASTQLPNGDIFSVYYLHESDGVRYIGGTRWSLNEISAG
jgi:sialidase-1